VTAVHQDPATALPGWMDLPDGLGAAEYEPLPEDICRRIEIVDGAYEPQCLVRTGWPGAVVGGNGLPPVPGYLRLDRRPYRRGGHPRRE
jgi:hypothetical protein